MAVIPSLVAEMKHESGLTRKILERVPLDRKDWKPHDKSMSLGRLATHIAELPRWVKLILEQDIYDFAANPVPPRVAGDQEELMKIFEENLEVAMQTFAQMQDEVLEGRWKAARGELILYDLPKKVVLRSFAYSHIFHHRGQLSVYLRLLDIPVPGLYGPSADER